jgi:subtilisin family serine protease
MLLAVLAGSFALAGSATTAAMAATAAAAPSLDQAFAAATGTGPQTTVTLLTGDVVTVATLGKKSYRVVSVVAPDGTPVNAAVMGAGEHLYVVPQSAVTLIARHKLDTALFDVAGLVQDGYDDPNRRTVPFIVDYGHGPTAAAEARSASIATTQRTVTVPSIGAAAFVTRKASARSTWQSMTTGPAAAPTGLAGGAQKVWLDGKVETTVQPNLEQINAPQAWATGFDGQGVTVAVLDGGYDATHPDLQGKVADTANFTTDTSVVDGAGHGTHVASTIVGAGEADNGNAEGVAPGARLMVGKVIGDAGWGEDSWVLAGMQWAVANGADVVNMSIGSGGSGDDNAPLAQAVDALSADSDTLFVVAAGNTGWDGDGSGTINAPGSADAALTVGAVDSGDAVAWFSSRGPRMTDGAIKPDVTAPGVGIVAARAAGTVMGTPVDEYYTAMDGTSMATPQVTGVAALLKDKHPLWDGERLKAAIVGSAASIPAATAFQTGSGRVDAFAALRTQVVTDASLNLGFYKWPQATLSPTATPLTYTNTTANAITLDLSLASQDGTGAAAPGITLGSSSVQVPAHSSATVDVNLDPTLADPGSYASVVTATPATSGPSVRTPVGYTLEPERYDLTINAIPRNGIATSQHILGLVSSDGSYMDFRTLDAAAGTQSYTLRVPPLDYSLSDISYGIGTDGSSQGWIALQPSFHVGKDRSIDLDGRAAKRFTYTTERPTVDSGLSLLADWNAGGVPGNVMLTGMYDRVYAPGLSSTINRSVKWWSYWLLNQPEAQATTPSGTSVSLRPVARAGVNHVVDDVPTPRLEGSFRVVDGGTAADPQLKGVRGAVVVLSSPCDDLAPAAAAAKAAGARAVIGYPTSECTPAILMPMPTLSHRVGIPVLQTRPDGAAQLLTVDGLRLRFATNGYPKYIYDLMDSGDNGLPAGNVTDGSDDQLHALVTKFRGLGAGRGHGYRVSEIMVPFTKAFPDAAPWGTLHRLPIPATVTRYISASAQWQREVYVNDARQMNAERGSAFSFRSTYAAGERSVETWFGGPLSSWISPEQARLEPLAQPNRTNSRSGDRLNLSFPPLEDDYGHVMSPSFFDDVFVPALWIDGQRYYDFWDVPLLNASQHVRYTQHWARTNGFWNRSTDVRTAWGFDTKHSSNAVDAMPLMTVDYGMPLNMRNGAPKSARYEFTVRFTMPMRVVPAAVTKHHLAISWNDGKTWKAVQMSCQDVAGAKGGQDTVCDVAVRNHASGSASFKVSATDTQGRSVKQTIIGAYSVE